MCGIVGFADVGGAVREPRVERGLDVLSHRGPDARGIETFRSGDVRLLLGHTRLRVIDLSRDADQPIANEDGTVQVVFNGELYNFIELRDELRAAGHRFVTRTDTEVLVHLYEEVEGDVDRMLGRLRGMYAFALADLGRKRLVLARDRLGIKPLYVATLPDGGIAFASEARALIGSGLVPAAPDTTSLVGYLSWGSVQGPSTVYAGIDELEAGSYTVWADGRATTRRWWEPAFTGTLGATEAPVALGEALGDSIQRHLVADREVGLFLSGGIDSGAIATLAARTGGMRSLTVTYPDADADEGADAAAVAASLGLHHDAVPVIGAEVATWLPAIARAMDQPTSDGVNSWIVSRAAHDAGLVVALSGLGGDELFGGYPSFRLVPRLVRGDAVRRLLPVPVRRRVGAALSSRHPASPGGRVLTAPPGVAGAYLATRAMFGPSDLRLLGAEHWLGPGIPEELFTPPEPGTREVADAVALLEMTRYMRNQLLRDTDAMSMAHSLEVRVPLLDDRVVDVAVSVPAAIRNRPGKGLLQAAAGLRRTDEKRGFTLPFDAWMRGPLRDPVRDLLLSEDYPLPWLTAADARRHLWDAFESRRVHWSRPWTIAVLRLWAAEHGLRW